MRIAIIGAGLAGLTAARTLKDAGLAPVVYDKGRGIGGRMATRRADGGLQFDHGAQYLTARSEGFAAFLAEMERADAAMTWKLPCGRQVHIGRGGMTAIPKCLADGVDVRSGVEVSSIETGPGGLSVVGEVFDRVICTVPAPQAQRLIGPKSSLSEALGTVVMDPNLTLMLALPNMSVARELDRSPDADIAWLALDSAKGPRPGPACWVAQAGLEFSKAHLELDKPQIAAAMLPLVCARLGASEDDALYVAAHKWRYAQASNPLGRPYLTDGDGLFIGGDWALSDRAEGAWQSGRAMAKAVLESR